MSNAASRWRRKRVKEEMAKKRAEKTIDAVKDKFINPTEEELEELSQAIADIIEESKEEEKESE